MAADVEAAAERGELDARQRALLLGFLDEGSRGFLAEVDGRLAGYAFVQPAGVYQFAGSGRLRILERVMVLKNLLVFPAFRGALAGQAAQSSADRIDPRRLDARGLRDDGKPLRDPESEDVRL